MKKIFAKIVAVSLLAILVMGSGFCIQSLLDSFAIKMAKAAAPTHTDHMGHEDVCSKSNNQPIQQAKPASGHHGSILPCCVDGGHSAATAIGQADKQTKVLPVCISQIGLRLPKPTQKLTASHIFISSPPDLVSVRKTVLRI